MTVKMKLLGESLPASLQCRLWPSNLASYIGQWLDVVIGCPFIGMDGGARLCVVLDNWQQRCCSPVRHQLHISNWWCSRGIHHAKDPQFSCCGSSPVILRRKGLNCEFVLNCNFCIVMIWWCYRLGIRWTNYLRFMPEKALINLDGLAWASKYNVELEELCSAYLP